jgi:GDP-D-mannose 3', 5'-epimerase
MFQTSDPILICGAGGFIGGHLTQFLLKKGYRHIRCVDCKPLCEWHQKHEGTEQLVLDLSEKAHAYRAVEDCAQVYNLAADMGGMGFIEKNKAFCMLSVLINTHLLMAARDCGVKRYFYASSACVYAADKQGNIENPGLKESDAYPAMPEDGYGWEKIFSERMCRHFHEDFEINTRVARYHNIYGPLGTFEGGREKAPAALCRKIAYAKLLNEDTISIWGDGKQTRSFTYIDDCVEGTYRLMQSDITEPVNVGSTEMISIDDLARLIMRIAGLNLKIDHDLNAPKGVRGRNSENTLIQKLLGWEPQVTLENGLKSTYAWIFGQISKNS